MICTTVRAEQDCQFMTKKGCGYGEGTCIQVIEQCQGCGRIDELETGLYCKVSPDPMAKWRQGRCNMATHLAPEQVVEKVKINPLKASKRGG